MERESSSHAPRVAIDALAIARRIAPGADVLVRVVREQSANTRFARNEITSCGDATETTVDVTVALGHKHASASSNQVDQGSVGRLAERALGLARVSPEDREHMPLLGQQATPKVDAAFDAATASLSAEARASAIGAAIAEAKRAGVTAAGFYQHASWDTVVANSAGQFAAHKGTRASLTMTARTADATGSGWAGAESQRASDIDAALVARTASE